MIPKIIHYCWLSDNPIPIELQKYMATWKDKLPDYQFMLWNKERFDIHSVEWVEQAYEAKKYAFAADYIRLYAVYTYGGIYMDMDVEVLKSFNPLLEYPYFFGAETEMGIEGGVFGAEKGCYLLKECLEFYKNRRFILSDGTYNIQGLPKVMYRQITAHHPLTISPCPNYQSLSVQVFPFDYFTAKSASTGVVKPTENTYTIHHFAGTWLRTSVRHRVKLVLVRIFGESMIEYLSMVCSKLKKR